MKLFRNILFFLIFSAFGLYADVRLELSRSVISTDDTVELLLHFDDQRIPSAPQMPLPEGLKFRGRPMLESISINGLSESRVRYTLLAEKPGEYTIGPFRNEAKGGEELIEAVTLTVTEPKVLTTTEKLFITLESSQTEALVQETVELTLSIYRRVRIGQIESNDFDENGYEISGWQQINGQQKTIGGQVYDVERYVATITPDKAGKLVFDPSFRIEVQERSQNSGNYYARYSTRIQRVKVSEPVELTVKHPPESGRPEDYAGHLGDFRLNAEVSPREVNVGDPVTLRVELRGRGSMQQALPPGLKESDDFKVYEPKLISGNTQRDGSSGRKVIEQVVIPKHEGVTEIPALTFSYYDVVNREYKTLQAGPFPLEVTDTQSKDDPTLISSLPSGSRISEPQMLGEGLIYLKSRPGMVYQIQDLKPGWKFVGLSGLPFVLWGLLALGVQRKQKQLADPRSRLRQEAPRRLRKSLQKLDQADGDFHSTVWEILSRHLSDRLGIPPGEITPEEIREPLADRISDSRLEELLAWMQACDRARYAGGKIQEDLGPRKQEFREFMLNLDRELGK